MTDCKSYGCGCMRTSPLITWCLLRDNISVALRAILFLVRAGQPATERLYSWRDKQYGVRALDPRPECHQRLRRVRVDVLVVEGQLPDLDSAKFIDAEASFRAMRAEPSRRDSCTRR